MSFETSYTEINVVTSAFLKLYQYNQNSLRYHLIKNTKSHWACCDYPISIPNFENFENISQSHIITTMIPIKLCSQVPYLIHVKTVKGLKFDLTGKPAN